MGEEDEQEDQSEPFVDAETRRALCVIEHYCGPVVVVDSWPEGSIGAWENRDEPWQAADSVGTFTDSRASA